MTGFTKLAIIVQQKWANEGLNLQFQRKAGVISNRPGFLGNLEKQRTFASLL